MLITTSRLTLMTSLTSGIARFKRTQIDQKLNRLVLFVCHVVVAVAVVFVVTAAAVAFVVVVVIVGESLLFLRYYFHCITIVVVIAFAAVVVVVVGQSIGASTASVVPSVLLSQAVCHTCLIISSSCVDFLYSAVAVSHCRCAQLTL
jgi:hypothetical protein